MPIQNVEVFAKPAVLEVDDIEDGTTMVVLTLFSDVSRWVSPTLPSLQSVPGIMPDLDRPK